jgi:hypothetical protein
MHISSRVASIVLVIAIASAASSAFTSCGTGIDYDPKPSLRYKPAAAGCGDIFVYKWNESGTEALIVQARREDLRLSTQSRTFRLDSMPQTSLHVWVDRYTRSAGEPYCTDVLYPDQERPRQWNAVSGTATITIDRDTVAGGELFKATVKLRNVGFTNGQVVVTLSEETFNDVTVGWYPG